MCDTWRCPKCGWTTDNPGLAREHFPTSLRVYRVITDEPQGVCIGFEPELVKYDTFCLDEDNGGDFVHILYNGTILINKLPEDAEPDLIVWRTQEEFLSWMEENET